MYKWKGRDTKAKYPALFILNNQIMILTNLPEQLRGPFVNAIYDRRTAMLNLKHTDGTTSSVETYPALFVEASDFEKVKRTPIKGILRWYPEKGFVRGHLDPSLKRDEILNIYYRLDEQNIKIYEADVSPVRRWFSDTGAEVSRTYKSLFFDLETHALEPGFHDEAKKKHRIICCAGYDLEGNSFYDCVSKDNDSEEAALIERILQRLQNYDVGLAWNGDNYDFFVLKERARFNDIRFDWRSINLLDYMMVTKKIMASISDPDFKRSFALDNIGENVLGIKKLKLPVSGANIWKLYKENPALLEEYNRRDVEIMLALEKKREFLALHYALCSICRTFPHHGSLFPNELADGILLRLAIEENRHFPTRTHFATQEALDDNKYEGAYVMDPVTGFHRDVQVPDFASLYPSIMISWNMSNETILTDVDKIPHEIWSNAALAKATGVRFRTDIEGIIPRALKLLIKKRKEYNDHAKQFAVDSEEYRNTMHLSTAVKVVNNSFYGLIGNQASRYYCRDIARSVTLTGQLLIRDTVGYLESKGYTCVAGDTDSCFIQAKPEQMKAELENINNIFIPGILTESKCTTHAVRMEYDKGYKALLIVAKKRYTGKLALWKGRDAPEDMKPEVKGLEVQRSETIRYARDLQWRVIHMLLRTDLSPLEVDKFLLDEAEKFFFHPKTAEEITITESLSKYPHLYHPKTTGSRVAEWMIANGMEFFVNSKIPYIVVQHNPHVDAIHASTYTGNFDRHYYWENHCLRPTMRLVNARFPKYSFVNVKDPRQKSFDFSMTEVRPVQQFKKVKKVAAPQPSGDLLATIRIPYTPRDSTIRGIAKLARAYPGSYKIKLIIDIGDGEVTLSTEQTINQPGINEIRSLFSDVKIETSLNQ